jgi:hypothetical protein
MSLDQEDLARGARVEIAIEAARKGDVAVAVGILAGMSREERDVFGPLVTASFPAAAGRGWSA